MTRMRWFRFAMLVIVTIILQLSLADIVAVTTINIKPDLLLILLVFSAIHFRGTEAIITSFTIGFAVDIIGPRMGPQIISFGLFGTLLAELHGVIAIRKWLYQSLAIFVVGFLTAALSYFFMFIQSEPVESNAYTKLFWTPLYSAIVGPILFVPIELWLRTQKREIRRF